MPKFFVLSLTVLLAGVASVQAQDGLRVTGPPEVLLEDAERAFMQPVWSPDGSRIALAGSGYNGIWVVRRDGTGLRQVTDEAAAGYGFSWSADGTALLARVSRYENRRRYNAVKVFDLAQDTVRQLTDYRTFMPSLPRWAPGDGYAYLYTRGRLNVMETGLQGASKTLPTAPVSFLAEQSIGRASLPEEGIRRIQPFEEEATLINLAVSPDGEKVAFERMGGNLYVMNADGTGLVDLGSGHRPSWSPEGEWVVFMVTQDNGERFTASDLYAARADGGQRMQLTATPDRLEMSPAWSPDGRTVAFEALDEGRVYLLPVAP